MSVTDSKFMTTHPATQASIERAMRALVAEHHRFVWRVLRSFGLGKADADDAAQQVFMIAARKLQELEPGRERAFVYGTALRVAQNARRGLRRRREVPADEQTDRVQPDGASPERHSELERARSLLSELLQELPDKLRRILVLAEIEQLAVAEIAELEGLPVGTAASRLRVAREQFRTLVEAARDRNPFSDEP